MSFAERFGSFSNQSNYGNFTDLSIMMTEAMNNWAKKMLKICGLKLRTHLIMVYILLP